MLTFEISKKVKVSVPTRWLERVVEVFAREQKIRGKYNFSLAFVDNPTIKKLNKTYRGKDKSTDVLSFAEYEDKFISPEENFLGEIVISVPQAKRQAKEYGHSQKQEVSRLLVHGLAHLIGYEHENVSSRKAKKMTDFEEGIMKTLGF